MSQGSPDPLPSGASFLLIAAPSQSERPSSPHLNPIEIPPALSFLSAAPHAESFQLSSLAPADPFQSLAIEPVIHHSHSRLLLLNPGNVRIHVNDQLAPSLVLLKERDELRIEDAPAYQVTIRHTASLQRVPEGEFQHTCLVCRTKIAPGSQVLVCACGRRFHHDESPSEDALLCTSLVSQCPSCRRPIQVIREDAPVPQFIG